MIVIHKLILTVLEGNLIWIHLRLVHLAVANQEVWRHRLRVKSIHDASMVPLARHVKLQTMIVYLSTWILFNWNACSSIIEMAQRAGHV